jgi:hypothetical protein
VLAATHHDPDDRMLAQVQRVLPLLQQIYHAIVVLSSPQGGPRTTDLLRSAGVRVELQTSASGDTLEAMGLVRLQTIRAAAAHDASHVHLCDFDRALHWAEAYPDELRQVVDAITRHDLLILGRTRRAFATHPRVQRDTEAQVNHVFGLAFGQALDITAASRGLSRTAIARLAAAEQPEPTIGNDGAWPLLLARFPDLVIGYATTEGLEWETPDRYGDEIAAAGGLDAWLADYDSDPRRWEFRARLALHEIAAINRWRPES